MTPEQAEYHRAMLLIGLDDRFEKCFDEALEVEDPLSDVILALSTCISDREKVLSVLREYTLTHPFDEKTVRDMILEDVRSRYQSGKMDRVEMVTTLYDIVVTLDKSLDDSWNILTEPTYYLELYEEDLICEDVFDQCFDAWFDRGERLDPWALQREVSKQKGKPKWWQKLFKK
jgi:hypothetical protein